MQEAYAKALFQAGQALAGDGWTQIQLARGGADGALVQYTQEQGQIIQSIHDYQIFIEIDC